MTTARGIMTGGAQCVQADETVLDAARKLKDLGVGALPIRGTDNRLMGLLTDRDIVVRVLGDGKDPASCAVGEPAQGAPRAGELLEALSTD
ncbi:CBS domain-containing protein [Streptomyces lichenis]|uniref:CBS domain-containing protein n=1 Tax=Streptomyces lichenis TaxID=2306967 RepID=UPI0035570671